MSNFLTDDIVALESLDRYEANLVVSGHSTDKFEELFGKDQRGVNVGDRVRLRKPNIEEVRTGWTADWKETDEDYVELVIGEPIGVDKLLTDKEMHLDLSSEGGQIIDGVMSSLAHKCEQLAIDEVAKGANFVGTPGTNPSALSTYLAGVARLRERMIPRGKDQILNVVSEQMQVDAVDFLKSLNQSDEALRKQYNSATIQRAAGMLWESSNMLRVHTPGSVAGSGLVNQPASVANGATSIALDDFTASQTGVIKRNDIITVDGMNACHPITKEDLGFKFPLVARYDADSDGGGNVTLYFEEPLYFSGPKQNVTAQPTNNGTVYLFGHASSYASTATRQGLMWVKPALARVYIPLDNADGHGVKGRTVTDKRIGKSIRYTRSWDQNLGKWKLRWDVWPTFKLLRPEWATRVMASV